MHLAFILYIKEKYKGHSYSFHSLKFSSGVNLGVIKINKKTYISFTNQSFMAMVQYNLLIKNKMLMMIFIIILRDSKVVIKVTLDFITIYKNNCFKSLEFIKNYPRTYHRLQ